jgi:2-oxoisovalerate dehydrogenase E2 component (dihydrolipoyl transacylase)
VGQVIISVEVAGGAPSGAATPPAGERTGPESTGPAAGGTGEGPSETEPEGRQPVLVGYGVSQTATRRRPRKPAAAPAPAGPQAELNGQGNVPAAPPRPAPDAVEVPPTAAGPGPVQAGPAPGATARPLAKPPVRKLAKDLGVDLTTVVPSGPDGIITREDVHASVPAPAGAPAAAPPGFAEERVTVAPPAAGETAPATWAEAGARETRIPVRGVRKATAQAMVDSAFTAPHVTEFVTIDVTRTMELIDELKRDADVYGLTGLRVNPLLLVAKALLVAIKRNPEVNASWDEASQEIVQKHYVNLGIAAATPRGLIVPNIKDAHAKTLPELAEALADLVTTAREGRTSPGAMQGGTVTITNVGVFGIDTGTPILPPGESAILAVGAIKLQPWVHEGEVVPRQVTTLALSFDHRLVDGELGAKVLADVARILEEPKRLITWG